MDDVIVCSSEPVTLVGGGNVGESLLLDTLRHAPLCVAADGGADKALAAGVVPEAVIGDLDSLSAAGRAAVPCDAITHVAEQDSTDFDKALRHISAPLVLGVGFLGARLDHQLAALHVLVRYPDRPCVLIGDTELVLLCPPSLSLPTRAGQVVSLFPMAAVRGRSEGLQWPIDAVAFDPLGASGTSNAATGPVHIEMESPHMLVMLPTDLLAPLIEGLVTAPPSARWPARAR